LGSSAGEQILEVEANTFRGADSQLRRIYGAERVSNLHEVSSGGGSSLSDIGDMGGWFVLGCIVFATWLMMEFWWIIVPIGAICALGWIADKTRHWWDK
jgi:hypothetical protein